MKRIITLKSTAFLTFLLLMLTAACSQSPRTMSDAEWHEVKERLARLDEAIAAQSPRVVEIIDSGMRHAADSLEYYSYLLRMANYYYLSATPDSMLPYIDQTLQFCHRSQSSSRLCAIEAQALENKANYYQLFRWPLDSVVKLHREAYELLLQSDLTGLVPTLCGNMADAYALNNQPAEAATWYRKAIFWADSMHLDTNVQATLYLGLARVYQSLGDYDQADHNFLVAARNYDDMDISMKVFYLNNRGTFYYYQGDYENAEHQFLQLEQLLQSSGMDNTFDMILCKINLADVSLNLGKNEVAHRLVDEVEPLFAAYGVTDGVYYAHSIRIGLAVKDGQTAQVPALLASEDFPPPTEQGLLDIRNRYLRDYYMATGQSEAAYENLLAEKVRNDSLQLWREHALAAETMIRLGQDTMRLHHELAMEQQRGATRTARMWVAILVGVVLLLLLFAVFWVGRVRKRRLQADMRIMQLRLQSVRQRISPHFVFNVLSRQQGKSSSDSEQELTRLAQLIRANLEVVRHTLIPLKEELDFVSSYVSMECGDDVNFNIDLGDGIIAEEILVPSMFVQILTENAVKHGLKGIDGEKRLTITVREQESGLIAVTVENNGRQFDVRATQGNSTGTGLSIIRETMAIYNERNPRDLQMDFSLTTLSDGTGCRALLHLPKNMKTLE